MDKLIRDILELGRTVNPHKWDTGDVGFKLMEEIGELSVAVQVKRNKLNKSIKEDEFGELADAMNCIIDLVNHVNPDMPIDEFMERLYVAMATKTEKWKKSIEASGNNQA